MHLVAIVLLAGLVTSHALEKRVYFGLIPALGTAQNIRRTLDLGSALEWPVGETRSMAAGLHFLSHDPAREPGYSDQDLRRSALGGYAALRQYPWEWAPGFFAEGFAGYEWSTERVVRFEPASDRTWGGFEGMPLSRVYNRSSTVFRTYEAGLGFGYLWQTGPLLVNLRFVFGPRWESREDRLQFWGKERSGELASLLRFRDLEIGFAI